MGWPTRNDWSPQQIVDRLDALSRRRALRDWESVLLERAIREVDGEIDPDNRLTGRDAARAGVHRNMGVYARHK